MRYRSSVSEKEYDPCALASGSVPHGLGVGTDVAEATRGRLPKTTSLTPFSLPTTYFQPGGYMEFYGWASPWLDRCSLPESIIGILERDVESLLPWEGEVYLMYSSRHIGYEIVVRVPSFEEWDVEYVEEVLNRALHKVLRGIKPSVFKAGPRRKTLRMMTERERNHAADEVFGGPVLELLLELCEE